jgi:hypothetical protein
MVEKVALGQVSSESFGFSLSISFHRCSKLLHTHSYHLGAGQRWCDGECKLYISTQCECCIYKDTSPGTSCIKTMFVVPPLIVNQTSGLVCRLFPRFGCLATMRCPSFYLSRNHYVLGLYSEAGLTHSFSLFSLAILKMIHQISSLLHPLLNEHQLIFSIATFAFEVVCHKILTLFTVSVISERSSHIRFVASDDLSIFCLLEPKAFSFF